MQGSLYNHQGYNNAKTEQLQVKKDETWLNQFELD